MNETRWSDSMAEIDKVMKVQTGPHGCFELYVKEMPAILDALKKYIKKQFGPDVVYLALDSYHFSNTDGYFRPKGDVGFEVMYDYDDEDENKLIGEPHGVLQHFTYVIVEFSVEYWDGTHYLFLD